MRILTLNLRAGGGTRIPALVEALVARDADVLVLTEFRIGPSGTRLLDLLRQHRYEVHLHNDPPAGTNSAVIVSRLPLTSERSPHHRIVAAELHGIQLRGIYLPLNQAKVEFWEEHFGRVLGSLRDEPAILIGDFNTGAADERQSLVRFAAEDRYEAMFRQG